MQMTRLNATWPYQALADDTRFRVVRLLASSGRRLGPAALARALQVAPSHHSRHLQVLQHVGLTSVEREGHRRHIAVRAPGRAQRAVLTAVCAMDDDRGVFEQDLRRLLADGPAAQPAMAPPGAR
jgi:DNA-binding transcriptional ArsR family regulator